MVSQWLGHATPEVTLRIYLPIVGSNPLHGGRAVGSRFELLFSRLRSCETVASSVVAETSLNP